MTTERLHALHALARGDSQPHGRSRIVDFTTGLQDALDEVQHQSELIAALAAALRPFACLLDWIEGEGGLPDSTPVAAARYLCVGDLRRAAEAMGRVGIQQREEGNECE